MEPSRRPAPSEPAPVYDLPIENREKTDHAAALATTRSLCRSFARMHPQAGTMIDPSDVIAALDEAAVQFVLMGAHGIGGWLGQARATRDVDLVVRKSHHKKAVRALGRRFPELVLDEHEAVTRFLDPASGEPVLDVMRPVDLYQHTFDDAIQTELGHRVPSLEMAIASKFRALVSRNRPEEKQHLDASDFIQMVKRHRDGLNRDRLRQLGEAIYPDGGDHLLKMVDDVLAGRRLRI
jgi:hypothetical protein